MKGGRTAPRDSEAELTSNIINATSMKGGRTAPRDLPTAADFAGGTLYFNEGGADCPPRRSVVSFVASRASTSMKGGRTAPRDVIPIAENNSTKTTSMKGGRTAPRDRRCYSPAPRIHKLQ